MSDRDVARVARHLGDPAAAGPTDPDLLCRFLAGRDEAAFDALVRRHDWLVRVAVAQVLPDPADRDDAVQATNALALARAGKADVLLAASGERLVRWDADTGKFLNDRRADVRTGTGTFGPDGRTLVSTLPRWDPAGREIGADAHRIDVATARVTATVRAAHPTGPTGWSSPRATRRSPRSAPRAGTRSCSMPRLSYSGPGSRPPGRRCSARTG